MWSPNDRHIAFLSDRDGNHSTYVMAADGTDVLSLGPSSQLPQLVPVTGTQ